MLSVLKFTKNLGICKAFVVVVVSVFIGRQLMSVWMGDSRIHELYTAACGLYICWLVLRISTVLYNWIPQGGAVIANKLKEWAMLVSWFWVYCSLPPFSFTLCCPFLRGSVHLWSVFS